MTNFILIYPESIIPIFLEKIPEFKECWSKHLEYWNGKEAGPFNDIAELAHFVVKAYEKGELDIIKRAFDLTEELLEKSDPHVKEILIVGFIENVQTISSNRKFGMDVFLPFLGPLSKQGWYQIIKLWEGKSSLMDVIRAQNEKNK